MTLLDELLKNEWDAHWLEGDEPRELLSKIFRFEGLIAAADAGTIIAKLSLEHGLEKEVSFTISDWNVVVFLNAYNPGPLNDTFYSLATDIQNQLAEV